MTDSTVMYAYTGFIFKVTFFKKDKTEKGER